MAKNIITPTTDLFAVSLWSVPKNEPSLRSLLNGVMTDIGLPPAARAIVKNAYNIQTTPLTIMPETVRIAEHKSR